MSVSRLVSMMLLAALTACGGSSNLPRTSALQSRQRNASPTTIRDREEPFGTGARLTIALPGIAAGGVLLPGKTPRNYLSSATLSLRVSFGSDTIGTLLSLSVKAGTCSVPSTTLQSQGVGLVCVARVSAPVGSNQRLQLFTYKTVDGKGAPLAESGGRINIARGLNEVEPKFAGIARRMAVRLSATNVWQQTPCAVVVTVYGIDSTGGIIPSRIVNGPNGKPLKGIVLSGEGPYVFSRLVANGQGYPKFDGYPFMSALFQYDGRRSGVERIVAQASSGGVVGAPSKLPITFVPAPNPVPQIFVGNAETGSPVTIDEFSASASGNTPPLASNATFGNGALGPVATDAFGNYWVSYYNSTKGGILRFNSTGVSVGQISPYYPKSPALAGINVAALDSLQNVYTVNGEMNDDYGPCYFDPLDTKFHAEIQVYAAGTYMARRLTTVDIGHQCSVPYLAVDGAGDMFVGEYNAFGSSTTGNVAVYGPANANGKSKLLRTIPQTKQASGLSNSWLAPYVVDKIGDLFEVNNMTATGGLLEYPAGSLTPTALLPGYAISFLALDGSGNIYAQVVTLSGTFGIDVFLPGASSPTRIIAGSSTGLAQPHGIDVAL